MRFITLRVMFIKDAGRNIKLPHFFNDRYYRGEVRKITFLHTDDIYEAFLADLTELNGMVKQNVDPLPFWLLTQISPP